NISMIIMTIRTEEDYQRALKRLEVVFDAAVGTADGDEADILGLMIDKFEKKQFPIEAIKIRMEEM
ncbi:MAG TPA: transcriptional regulator, partial [Desulfosporosinus sp.]|nr:transcriptional regulator [Desulfosporosinus sp.]